MKITVHHGVDHVTSCDDAFFDTVRKFVTRQIQNIIQMCFYIAINILQMCTGVGNRDQIESSRSTSTSVLVEMVNLLVLRSTHITFVLRIIMCFFISPQSPLLAKTSQKLQEKPVFALSS